MSTDVEPIVADLRGAIARFNAAIDQVSAELPAIATEARTAVDAASRAAQRFETLIDAQRRAGGGASRRPGCRSSAGWRPTRAVWSPPSSN